MGRATATRGQGRLGRTIRKLENSVELSSKEGRAKLAEQNYRKKTNQPMDTDSPIQNLRDASKRKKIPCEK